MISLVLFVQLIELDIIASDVDPKPDSNTITESQISENDSKMQDSSVVEDTTEQTEESGENQENLESRDIDEEGEVANIEGSDSISDFEFSLSKEIYISELTAEEEKKDTIKLKWKVEDSEDTIAGFEISLYTDELLVNKAEGFEQTIEKENISENIVEATISGLNTGVVYYIKVTPYSVDKENISTDKEYEVVKVLLLSKSVLKATTSEGTVNLSWTEVDGAEAYDVYQVSGTDRVLIGTVTGKTSFVHKVPRNNATYSYVVSARANDAKSEDSNTVSATPRTKKPGKVNNLTGIDGEKKAILTWSKAENATSYYIYRYNSSKKKWDLITNVTGTTFTDKNLKTKTTYKYRVKAIRTVLGDTVLGDVTTTISVSVKSTPGTKVCPMNYKATIKSKAPCFTSKSSKKRVNYLKPGTKVTTIDYGNGRYLAKLSNGKKYWISKDRLKFTASIWTTKDYSTITKTNFVNSKGYKSPTKYLIWISQYTQRVVIYQGSKGKWKVIRSCRCATGTYNGLIN